jgi:hypothetical protein
MDARMTTPVSAPALAPARVDAAPVRAAVRTELAVPQAVSAQVGAEQTRFGRKGQSSQGEEKRTAASFDVDRETGELIYKVVDKETHSVLSQYPYDSLLKLRAYIRSQDEAENG